MPYYYRCPYGAHVHRILGRLASLICLNFHSPFELKKLKTTYGFLMTNENFSIRRVSAITPKN